MSEVKHVSVHIEKTAGTAVLNFYDRMYCPHDVFIYNPIGGTVIRHSESGISTSNPIVDRLKYLLLSTPFMPFLSKARVRARISNPYQIEIDQLPDDFKVVHGHFTARTFEDYIPEAIMSIIIRDPLDRMISHFRHWKRIHGNMNFRVVIPYNSSVSFCDFALMPKLKNYQTQALDGHDLSDFNMIGTTDDVNAFARQVLLKANEVGLVDFPIGQIEPTVPVLNAARNRRLGNAELGITKEWKREFRRFHSEDYDLYYQAKNLAF